MLNLLPENHPGLKTRACIDCGVVKVGGEFPLHRHPHGQSGFVSLPRCHECNAKFKRDSHYKRTYGITSQEFDDLLTKQQGLCAICGKPGSGEDGKFVLDHCHKTGNLRELLCISCNVILGQVNDDPSRLYQMINYLNKHSKNV